MVLTQLPDKRFGHHSPSSGSKSSWKLNRWCVGQPRSGMSGMIGDQKGTPPGYPFSQIEICIDIPPYASYAEIRSAKIRTEKMNLVA